MKQRMATSTFQGLSCHWMRSIKKTKIFDLHDHTLDWMVFSCKDECDFSASVTILTMNNLRFHRSSIT